MQIVINKFHQLQVNVVCCMVDEHRRMTYTGFDKTLDIRMAEIQIILHTHLYVKKVYVGVILDATWFHRESSLRFVFQMTILTISVTKVIFVNTFLILKSPPQFYIAKDVQEIVKFDKITVNNCLMSKSSQWLSGGVRSIFLPTILPSLWKSANLTIYECKYSIHLNQFSINRNFNNHRPLNSF